MTIEIIPRDDAERQIVETIQATWDKAEFLDLGWKDKIDALITTLNHLKSNYVDF
mgnify:CR=1 FL=1